MLDAHRPRSGLFDRVGEREVLDRLVAGVRAGEGQVLVLRGEAGVGKTALLGHVSAAEGCRVAWAAGVESEMELAFAGLHALCAPMLGRLGRLPSPQREALSTAFGLSAGPPPDRFFVGLAVLSLLADTGEEQPLAASSTTPNGSTASPRRRSRSWRAGSWRNGWDWCSPCASPATSERSTGCRSS
jgi:hypothetical protein